MSITKKSKIYSTCLFIFFVIIAIITLLPLALLAVSSLRPGSDLMRYGLNFSIDWASANLNEYKMLFSGANSYFIWYKNSLIITIVQVGLALFFFRQYLMGIPKDFLDAARVDGCTEYGIFFKIMIPLMKPSFAAMGIYQGMQSWNNFLWPMIVTNSIDKITLPVGLQSLLSPYGNNYDILIAGSCFAIIPILILFICFQRYFIEGMTAGGVKG